MRKSDDTISRQAAIETLTRLEPSFRGSVLEQALKNMPPAQPEIIRCKDCKYFAGEGMYCGQNICVQFDHFYCYYGERKE